jgi:hypothetical protein
MLRTMRSHWAVLVAGASLSIGGAAALVVAQEPTQGSGGGGQGPVRCASDDFIFVVHQLVGPDGGAGSPEEALEDLFEQNPGRYGTMRSTGFERSEQAPRRVVLVKSVSGAPKGWAEVVRPGSGWLVESARFCDSYLQDQG